MGRGRQKAKATRQAREMKYFSPQTDLDGLLDRLPQRGHLLAAAQFPLEGREETVDEDEDDYSAYVDKYADDYDEDFRR